MEDRLRACEQICARMDERMKTIESEHALVSQVAKDLLMLKTNYEARKESFGRGAQIIQLICTLASLATAISMAIFAFSKH